MTPNTNWILSRFQGLKILSRYGFMSVVGGGSYQECAGEIEVEASRDKASMMA